MKRYISLLPMLLLAAIGVAQTANDTINRMVLVESTYNPIIAGAIKRNFIPEEVKPSMSKEQVVYADESVGLIHFDRQAQPAQATKLAYEDSYSGYAHLGYGNYNNLNGLAAYKWRFNAKNNLALKANVNGWNGKFRLDDDAQWRSHLYDMGLNADYNTLLGNVALNVGAHGTYHNYNYLGTNANIQQAANLGGHLGINGSIKERYHYHAIASYTRFGRSTYFGEKAPHNESHIHGEASFGMDLYEWGMASVLLHSDALLYQGLADYSDYYSFGITPQWEYWLGDFRFISGFNMDFLIGENIAHPLQLSPECSISYIPSNRFSALLTLDGGRDIHTFSSLYERSPYWATMTQIRPSYTFLNAHLDGGIRIIEGLHLHVGGGYKILSDALFETSIDTLGITFTGINNHKVQVATADASISYTHKDLVSLSAKSTYNHWMLQGNQALLARAPQFDTDVDVRVRIMPTLHTYTNLKWVVFTDVASRERAIIDWSLGAHYALNKRFAFFLDAHNLLNRRYSYYTGYPSQGFNVLAGAKFKF
ncbi:MAG: hypothetical protein IKT86_06375 [Bacteroidaceae bacterium]|nr:hypothetical protein [Bacteroidaceae bacterium]